MKNSLIKEGLLILLIVGPAIYLLMIWSSLPAQVPMHYDINGKVNRYGSKTELVFLSFGISLVVYLVFLFVPYIDPKGKIKAMGNIYFQLKLVLILFMSVLSFYIIYTSKNPEKLSPNIIFNLVGLLFTVLGYQFQSIKPNYFIGIRTPWTLENETVWKDTHRLGGKIWIAGGLLIGVLGFIIKPEIFIYLFVGIVAALVLIPAVYSYRRFKAVKSSVSED